MHSDFNKVKNSWWWIPSKKSYDVFLDDPFAQGYELLARSEKFRTELATFFRPPGQTWKQLYRFQRDYFSVLYGKTLTRLSLRKDIFAGPLGISFDATERAHYLLTALKSELSSPTVRGAGVNSGRTPGFRTIAKFQSHSDDTEVYTARRPDTSLWQKGTVVKTSVYLPLPQKTIAGKCHELTKREIFAYFRNFVKDNPPADFNIYRETILRKTAPLRQEKSSTLALGLMAVDYAALPDAELKDLADWLSKTLRGKIIFKLEQQQLLKALYHAKNNVCRLFDQIDHL